MTYRKDWVATPQVGGQGFVGTRKMIGRRINLAVADLNGAGNVVGAFVAPAGFTVQGILFAVTDMDTGGAATLSLSVGDAGSAFRFLNADVAARTGGVTTTLAATGVLYRFPADTEIQIQVSGVPQTPAAGTVDLYLDGFVTS